MKYFAIVVLLAISGANADFWRGCNIPGVVTPNRVESPFCSGTSCIVSRGDTLVADAWVTPVKVHHRLDVSVTAFVGPVGIPLPLEYPDDNACNSLLNPANREFWGCPTVPNRENIWEIHFHVPATFPTFNNARVRFEIKENGVLEFCADVTATLV